MDNSFTPGLRHSGLSEAQIQALNQALNQGSKDAAYTSSHEDEREEIRQPMVISIPANLIPSSNQPPVKKSTKSFLTSKYIPPALLFIAAIISGTAAIFLSKINSTFGTLATFQYDLDLSSIAAIDCGRLESLGVATFWTHYSMGSTTLKDTESVYDAASHASLEGRFLLDIKSAPTMS